MVTDEEDRHRKSEYVVIRYGQDYYYARASREHDNQYDILTKVGQKEGSDIVAKANLTSTYHAWLDENSKQLEATHVLEQPEPREEARGGMPTKGGKVVDQKDRLE